MAGTLAVVLSAMAACSGSSKKAATPTTRTPVTTATTPSSTAGGPATSDREAIGLNRSLLSAAEVAQAMGLTAPPTPETPGAKATPQGPITEQAILAVLPNAAVYKPLYDNAGGGNGANVTYHVASPKIDIDILAVKFATQQGGQSFVRQASNIATTLAQGKATAHPEMALGVLPAADQAILRVPPGPVTDPTQETVVTDILYGNGVFYLVTLMSAPAAVSDAHVIALARAQDAKYQADKSAIGAG
jgi:hypothetical protein